MKFNRFTRLTALVLCLCMLPISALGYGEVTVYQDPVTRTDLTFSMELHPDAFPDQTAADYKGWEAFLDKISFKGLLDVQNPLTDKVRGWFDGGLYLNDRLCIPFQVDVYFTFRYLQSLALKDESMFFKMENFFEFMMKFRYFMDLPADYLSILMYPEAALEMRDRFYTPLAELCAGTGDRVVPYDDLYDLFLSWEDMYMTDEDDYYKIYYFLTNLLYDIGINYDVYDGIGMATAWLDMMDPEGAGMIITTDGKKEYYTLGETVVFQRSLTNARYFTLTIPDEDGNVVTLRSTGKTKEGWLGDDWRLRLKITLAPEEPNGRSKTFLYLNLDMRNIPNKDLYQTSSVIYFDAKGSALEEPINATFDLYFNRTDIKKPNQTTIMLSPRHPETGKQMMTFTLDLRMSEVPFTVLQERDYPHQEDFFHLNDEYLQRIKESYIPSLAISFLPVLAEMPAGVINDILHFAEETGILASLGIE